MSTLVRLSPGEAVAQSYKESLVVPDSEKAKFLLEQVGPRIVTVGMGLADARQIRAWAHQESSPRGDAPDRLRILFRVVFAVASVYGGDTAAAFVRGANPGLDDESVLSVLTKNTPTEETEKRLMGVVRDFLDS